MNHYLKQLSELAEQHATRAIKNLPDDAPVGFMDYYTEHLVKLVITECAQLADSSWDISGNMIKKHFGME
jgi:hypothetical protein